MSAPSRLPLRVLDGTFDLHRLPPDAALPARLAEAEFVWMARTPEELSIVCRPDADLAERGRASRGWAALRVEGSIAFEVVGVLAGISGALAAEGISLFALSTFDTDYVLVREGDLERAVGCLAAAGHAVAGGARRP